MNPPDNRDETSAGAAEQPVSVSSINATELSVTKFSVKASTPHLSAPRQENRFQSREEISPE
jgi:hypothetical protein